MDLRQQHLKRYLRDLKGDDQVDLFRFSLSSLGDRVAYATYHLDEATRLMSAYTSGAGPRPGDDHGPFNAALTHTAAHVLACLQSLHACADICAHVVYYGLGSNLDPKPIEERRVGVSSVLARIPESPVSIALSSITKCADFEYLDAVVNRSKHRSVVYTAYSFDPRDSGEDQSWHGVKLWKFERHGRTYPSRRTEEFLTAELDRQRVVLSAVCEKLEEELISDWNEQRRLHQSRGEHWPPARAPSEDA